MADERNVHQLGRQNVHSDHRLTSHIQYIPSATSPSEQMNYDMRVTIHADGNTWKAVSPMAQAGTQEKELGDASASNYDQRIVVPDRFETKELSWFASSQIPTDLSIQVEHCIFKVHKYPLVSRCGYMSRLELEPSISSNSGSALKLENFPGGLETFEIILRFCYGLAIDLNPANIAALRCASEYLEMGEEFEDGNLISKTEAFLTFVVLASWKDTVAVLKSCENLSPWAENLQVVRRCCDSIAYKASRETSSSPGAGNEEAWWIDDVATLRIDHFMKIMSAVRAKGTKAETIGKCIIKYGDEWLPGIGDELQGLRGYGLGKNELQLSILSTEHEQGSIRHYKEQRAIIESLVSIIPIQPGAVSCKFLLQVLKAAMLYSASPALISELEKRVGMILEDAHADDLLIPNYRNDDQETVILKSAEKRTIHNIDMVQRIVESFLTHEQQKTGKTNVSKILDNYLAEIARDPNLSMTKFQALAEALPANSRSCDDGLYRAIDTYLKTHPSLSEHDRRRLCKLMNSEKLSLDACMHAAQNDRLPLRTVIQVLFSEQVKMRRAMEGKESATRGENQVEQEETHPSTNAEMKGLKTELENVKAKMTELGNDYAELQREYDKISSNQKSPSGWSLGWRKIKKSFHTKPEADVNVNVSAGAQLRSNNPGHRRSFLRRLSLS